MALRILFVSPEHSIAESLVSEINAAGTFQAAGALSPDGLSLNDACVDVAFLDLDLGAEGVAWGEQLRGRCPQVRLALIVGDSAVLPEAAKDWPRLHKPFRLQDFDVFLQRLLEKDSAVLDDREQVGLALQDALKKTTAQAALVLRAQQLWAFTGSLPEQAMAEVADEILRIVHIGSGNLLRFVHLRKNQSQHMLYVMLLDGQSTLGILFDPDASFAEIRLQAERIVTHFRQAVSLPPVAASLANSEAAAPQVDQPPAEFSAETAEEDIDEELFDISDILKDVPAPTPSDLDGDPLKPPWQDKPPSIEAHPPRRRPTMPADLEQTRVSRLSMLDETRLSAVEALEETRRSNLGPTRPSAIDDEKALKAQPETAASDQKSHSLTQAMGHLVLEPASPAFYNLRYACLLLTRRREHTLDGDLKTLLQRWMRDIAVAYGWRIELMRIFPEFMQWIISIPPATSPNEMMRVFRVETSRRILEAFPHLQADLADDFWAPGYLLMGGDSFHPPVAVERYINQIRSSQDF